jgi:hypothetical protein
MGVADREVDDVGPGVVAAGVRAGDEGSLAGSDERGALAVTVLCRQLIAGVLVGDLMADQLCARSKCASPTACMRMPRSVRDGGGAG